MRVPRADAPRVVEVLCDAFHDYPVMRFVIGDSGAAYAARLSRLIGFFVAARALRNDPMLAVTRETDLCGAATVSFPGRSAAPVDLEDLRESVWQELGDDARARYEACTATWEPFTVDVPHIHLNMIGVRRSLHGQGIARRLLDRVHAICAETPGARGVTLSTEDPANVPFYEHMGYEVVVHARVAPDLETWGFFRKA
ncbi:MAG: GNAT family N-acetyltransferase [Gemmatimonadetes bacterium]|nr:GNAT family N-acetyltransferase [Gemmatimonadota bacterium]